MKILTYKENTWYVDNVPYKDYKDALDALGIHDPHKVWVTRIKAENGIDTYRITW